MVINQYLKHTFCNKEICCSLITLGKDGIWIAEPEFWIKHGAVICTRRKFLAIQRITVCFVYHGYVGTICLLKVQNACEAIYCFTWYHWFLRILREKRSLFPMGSKSTANIQLADFSAVKEAEGPSGQGSGPRSLVLVCVLPSGPSTFLVYVLISGPFSFISLNLCSTFRSVHLHLSWSVFYFPVRLFIFFRGSGRSTWGYESRRCMLFAGSSIMWVVVGKR